MVSRDELQFVEEMGALFERLGYGRMTSLTAREYGQKISVYSDCSVV